VTKISDKASGIKPVATRRFTGENFVRTSGEEETGVRLEHELETGGSESGKLVTLFKELIYLSLVVVSL